MVRQGAYPILVSSEGCSLSYHVLSSACYIPSTKSFWILTSVYEACAGVRRPAYASSLLSLLTLLTAGEWPSYPPSGSHIGWRMFSLGRRARTQIVSYAIISLVIQEVFCVLTSSSVLTSSQGPLYLSVHTSGTLLLNAIYTEANDWLDACT